MDAEAALTGPTELLKIARTVLKQGAGRTAGSRKRASALLARQALERAVREVWQSRGVPIGSCPTRARLLCLSLHVPADVSRGAYHAWERLSDACHHHPYELGPSVEELESWIASVEGLCGLLLQPSAAEATTCEIAMRTHEHPAQLQSVAATKATSAAPDDREER
jgi:hypothetical protein